MATRSGRLARVTLGNGAAEKVVAEIESWDLDRSAGETDTSAFGSEWEKTDVSMKKFGISIKGFCDPEDVDGQDVLENSFENGTLIGDLKVYIQWSDTPGDKVIYFKPDTVKDAAAGVRVTNLKIGQSKSGVASIDIKMSGSGPVKRTIETI